MEYLVVCRVLDNNGVLKGYGIVALGSNIIYKTNDDIKAIYYNCKTNGTPFSFINAEFSENVDGLVGTMGDLSKYPAISATNFTLLTRNGISVAKVVLSAKTKEPLGVVCYNTTGVRYNLSFKKLMEIVGENEPTNFEIKVANGGKVSVIPKGKKYKEFATVEMQVKERSKYYRSANGEKIEKDTDTKVTTSGVKLQGAESSDELPSISGVFHFDENLKSSDLYKDVNQKFAEVSINLRKVAPYYYCMFQSVKMLPMLDLGTLAVTEDTLYYDVKFVSGLTVGELTFILIHEMSHIAMQHSVRLGSRNHRLWNIATDLYINTIICSDFSERSINGTLSPGLPEIKVKSPDGKETGVIKAPTFGIFVESIGETLDLSHDSPETIYYRLVKENPNFDASDFENNQAQGNKQANQQQQSNQQEQSLQKQSEAIAEAVSMIRGGANEAKDLASSDNAASKAISTAGSNQIDRGIEDIKQGQQNNDKDKLERGLGNIESGIKNMETAMQKADADNTREGIMSSNKMSQGLGQLKGALDENNIVQQSTSSDNGQGQQGQDSQDQQSQDQQGQDSQNQQGQGQQGQQGQQEQGQSQQNNSKGYGSSGNFNSNNNGSDNSEPQINDIGGNSDSLNNNLTQNTNNSNVDSLNNDSVFNNQIEDVTVTFNGKKLHGKIINDIMSNHNSSEQKEEMKKRAQESKQVLQDIKTKQEMESQKGSDTSAQGSSIYTQRHIEFGLEEGVDWRVILRNVCKREQKKIYTKAIPNRNYLQQKRIVHSRLKVGHVDALRDIKICIDVSGSVSDTDLNNYLSEIANIFKYYDTDGELIYWSTNIGDAGNFSELKDMLKVTPDSTGGTDVKCVFDYLSGKTKVNGKYQQTKVKDMACILILTDGQFDNNYSEYAKYFAKKTIWLIDGSYVTFNRVFGKVISLINDKRN